MFGLNRQINNNICVAMPIFKIRTGDIPTSWLNARCRNLISKYALLAFRYDSSVFDLRGENIVAELSFHAKLTDNLALKSLYQEVRAELRQLLSCPSFRDDLSMLAEQKIDVNKKPLDQPKPLMAG